MGATEIPSARRSVRYFSLNRIALRPSNGLPSSPLSPPPAFAPQDIVCPEAAKLDDLDPKAVTANYEAAKARASGAEAGSAESAEAEIELEVNKAMGAALGLALA